MTKTEFVLALEEYWAKKLNDAQESAFLQKLRFSPEQLDKLYDAILIRCRYLPKIADVFDAAQELGFIGQQTPVNEPHRWEPTGCPDCRGEGRINVYFALMADQERRQFHRIVGGPFQYSSPEAASFTPPQPYLPGDCYSFIFRCSCPAGEVATLGRWPRWMPRP